MKSLLKIVLLLLFPIVVHSQQINIDSLRNALPLAKDDSVKWSLCDQISFYYYESNLDSCLKYLNKGLLIAEKNNKVINVAWNLTNKGYQLTHLGRYAEAFKCLQDAFTILQDSTNETKRWMIAYKSAKADRLEVLSTTDHMYAILMGNTGNTKSQISYFNRAKAVAAQIGNTARIMLADMNLGYIYLDLHKADSALWYNRRAESSALQINEKIYLVLIYDNLGLIYEAKGDTVLARKYFHQGIHSGIEQNNYSFLVNVYNDLTKLYLAQQNKDSSLYYALKGLETYNIVYNNTNEGSTGVDLGDNYYLLSESYKLNNLFDSSYKYRGLAIIAKDSANSRRFRNLAAFQAASLNENLRLEQLEKDRVARENKIRTIILLVGIAVVLLITLLLYRNNRKEKKAKNLLKQKNKVIEQTLDHLKSTQSQLIQSEKMASLGELTAGIAHEIQNPLNFVNNFSEVNRELIQELKSEKSKVEGERDEQLETDILNDIETNEEKINHHGKRADAIVKGMLQHSRSSTGVKEPTDINALADEYLRLAYHGLRAKDKNFNAEFTTDFDNSIDKINIIPQDIGRVLLNLFNNAFYAVNARLNSAQKIHSGGESFGQEKKSMNSVSYQPTVSVTTKKSGNSVLITVNDNGIGIPQKIIDKIFQPFFTTKPTGQGTGLGLSLSYDIIKAHGGEIKVESTEGEGTEFKMILPLI